MSDHEAVELLRWIEQQHRDATEKAAQLHRDGEDRPAPSTAGELRQQFLAAAELAAAAAELEMWNELLTEIRDGLRDGLRPAG